LKSRIPYRTPIFDRIANKAGYRIAYTSYFWQKSHASKIAGYPVIFSLRYAAGYSNSVSCLIPDYAARYSVHPYKNHLLKLTLLTVCSVPEVGAGGEGKGGGELPGRQLQAPPTIRGRRQKGGCWALACYFVPHDTFSDFSYCRASVLYMKFTRYFCQKEYFDQSSLFHCFGFL
jgi:hypothetical protein